MSDNKSNAGEAVLVIILVVFWAIAAIVAAVLMAIVEFGKFVAEGAPVTVPLLSIVAWITYKTETAYQSSWRGREEPSDRALSLLKESQERAVTIFLGSGAIALFGLIALFGVDSSSGRRAAIGWLLISGTTCITYLLVLVRHQDREKELKAAGRRQKELEIRRRQEEEEQEREMRKRRLAKRLGDINLFLEDHCFEGALLALDELEKEYRDEELTISQVRRRVKDAEFAYHKARVEPHLQRLDGLLIHLGQMKQAKRS